MVRKAGLVTLWVLVSVMRSSISLAVVLGLLRTKVMYLQVKLRRISQRGTDQNLFPVFFCLPEPTFFRGGGEYRASDVGSVFTALAKRGSGDRCSRKEAREAEALETAFNTS